MKTGEDVLEELTFWQLVFSHSRVNGAPYNGDQVEGSSWNWPEDTYLQRRLRQIRYEQVGDRDNIS